MQRLFKVYLPHLVILLLFVVAALAYFSPVLQGKKMFQSDIVQYTGMAKQQNDFRKQTGEETYWTNGAFGGMPTYQLGAKYPHNYIKSLDLALRFLPRPADYLFLYFLGMYVLFLVLKVDYKLAFLGALAFGFSTYLIIILGVGHNAKAHAIAYMPFVLSGIFLILRGNYWYGFLLTAVALALELVANHFQMTYYLMLLVLIIGLSYLIDAYKRKLLPNYFKAVGIIAMAALIALGLNATNIMATKEYADASTRGKSELTINPDGSPKIASSGLDYNYITEYSYGKLESFNLFIPRLMGGGTSDKLPENSETLDVLLKLGASPQEANQILNQVPVYWGEQPIVAAPAYIGAVLLFLALLALFLVKGRLKWWIVPTLLLSLFLSWGKNLNFLTELFIDYVPLYNKFRAITSIQVLIELVVPILAILGLHYFFKSEIKQEVKKKALLYAAGILSGIALIFILFKSMLFDFASPYDSYFIEDLGIAFVDAMRADRASLLTADAIRSLVFVLLAGVVLWYFLKSKLKQGTTIALLAILMVVDLIGVDKRYVTNENFVSARMMDEPFEKNGADLQILEDKDYFRVYDAASGPFNSGRASYYHNALGGYHAAKLSRIQDIDDFYLSKGDIGILNMMNVRYIIVSAKNGGPVAQRNPYANGSAWFVENIIIAEDADEEIRLLDSLNTKKTAIIHSDFASEVTLEPIVRDSTTTIDLVSWKPNHLVYEAATSTAQLALFSEIHYPNGWTAYINGEEVSYLRANYILRAMQIPPGNNKIEFKFEPEVVKKGSNISLATSLLLVLIVAGMAVYKIRERNPPTKE